MGNYCTIMFYHIVIRLTLNIFLKTLHILQKDTEFGSQNFGYQIWFCTRLFSDILIKIHAFSFKKIHLKLLFWKMVAFCLGLNVLKLKKNRLMKPSNSDHVGWSLENHLMPTYQATNLIHFSLHLLLWSGVCLCNTFLKLQLS